MNNHLLAGDSDGLAFACVPASKWQVLGMALMPAVLLGAFGVAIVLTNEGWVRAFGSTLMLLGIVASFAGRRFTQGVRVIVDAEGARVIDGRGQVGPAAGVAWAEVVSAGVERRSDGDPGDERVLVLKDANGRDRFQLSRQLCAREHTRVVAVAIRDCMLAQGKPVDIPADWP